MRAAARAIAVAAVAASVVVLSACGTGVDTATAEPDAGIQLFQLPWASIAEECETTIGPAGFAWVLTSPPQEHIDRPEWWASYQPVSYEVDTRLGTRDEFADMVARCDAAGVEIIADAVVNHMTGQDQPGTGWAGAPYEHYDYPGLYGTADFHHCGLTANDDIEDYGSREQVQTCELVNLADLDTSSASVRDTIVAYLRDLLSLGVAGFRIDAAKHMAADDVAAIVGALPDGTRIMSEVIRGGGEPVQPEEYTGFGEVFEFTYARDLGPALASGIVNEPQLDGDRPMHVPSDDAVVFIDNHDTERGEAKVTYRQPALYAIANALMLADDYGTPVVYSGYAFSDRDAGAPVEGDGRVTPVACDGVTDPADGFSDGDRTCVQTWPVITGMLAFRAAVGDAARLPGQKEGDAYGFEREGRGVVAVNLGRERQAISIPTSLPSGEYCDVVTGGQDAKTDDRCRGLSYTVAEGAASFDLDPESVAAIHLGSSLSNTER